MRGVELSNMCPHSLLKFSQSHDVFKAALGRMHITISLLILTLVIMCPTSTLPCVIPQPPTRHAHYTISNPHL